MLAGALLLLAAPLGPHHPTFLPAQAPPELSACDVAAESSWGGGGDAHWEETARFGEGPDDWINGLTGMAFEPSLGLLAYDGSEGRIRILDQELQPILSFGRIGEGPGEFQELQMPLRDQLPYPFRSLIAVSGEHIHVWDHRRLSVFDHQGAFVESPTAIRGHAWAGVTGRGIRFMAAGSGGLVLGSSVSAPQTAGETLRTEQFLDGELRAVDSLQISWPPVPGDAMVASQAHSVWGSNGRCVVFGDGHSPWLVRTDLESGRTDTIPLPNRDVRPSGPSQVPDAIAELTGRTRVADPTAIQRWSAVAVDPDGHVWIHARSAHGEDGSRIFRVGADNEVVTESLQAFPRAFGPPGVVYVSERDRMIGILLVRMERIAARSRAPTER